MRSPLTNPWSVLKFLFCDSYVKIAVQFPSPGQQWALEKMTFWTLLGDYRHYNTGIFSIRHRDCTNDFAKMAATTACMQCDVILCQVAVYQPYLSICIYNALCLHYFCTLQLPKNKGLKSLSCKAIFKWESRPCSWYLHCNSFILLR